MSHAEGDTILDSHPPVALYSIRHYIFSIFCRKTPCCPRLYVIYIYIYIYIICTHTHTIHTHIYIYMYIYMYI